MRCGIERSGSRARGIAALSFALLALVASLAWSQSASAALRLEAFDVTYLNEDGTPATQAGSHPFAMKTFFDLPAEENEKKQFQVEQLKDIEILEAPGLVGEQTAVPTCERERFVEQRPGYGGDVSLCPSSTAVGVAHVTLNDPNGGIFQYTSPVYFLEAAPGKVAELGFLISTIPVIIEVGLNEDSPYDLLISTRKISQVLEFEGAEVTVWGVPASPAHDSERGVCAFAGGTCSTPLAEVPLLTLPRACEGPLLTSYEMDSWSFPGGRLDSGRPDLDDPNWLNGGVLTHDDSEPPVPQGMTGCERLAFTPLISAKPTTLATQSPTGLDLSLDANNEGLESPHGLAQSDIKEAIVTLPEGMTANPAVAAGLAGCSEDDLAREAADSKPGTGCPEAAKVGTLEVKTPLIDESLEGELYMATPYQNPFRSLLAMYFVIRNPRLGIIIKLPAEIVPDPTTGRLTTIVKDIPELPFSQFTLHLRAGARTPLVSPAACGSYPVVAQLFPRSDPGDPITTTSSFQVTTGPGGAPCPDGGTPPFKPTVVAGTENNAAGAYSPLYLRIERKDGEQEITGFASELPPGLSGNLTGIAFCSEAAIAQARQQSGAEAEASPACPAASQIGTTIAEAGVGSVLAQTPGKLYLGGPFEGAPFSIVDITSAKVGPFDLGTVVVHLPLRIDPITAQVTIPSGPADQIPHIIDGIVIHLRTIRVYVNRQDFTVNPTSCEPMTLSATVIGAGANVASAADDDPVSVQNRFQAASCQSLKFKPAFKASTSAHHTRRNGASLNVKIAYPKGALGKDANLAYAKVELPRALPSELKTLKLACLKKVFDANPAACPAESIVGHAVVHTPILPVPLEGPAYFVSNGGEAFPNLIMVLQGYGVTIELVGDTFIRNGVTSSTFKSTPDVPFESFELTLPEQKYSALAANGNLCQQKLIMPTYLHGQNGAQIERRTRIAVKGCPNKLSVIGKRLKGHILKLRVAVPGKGRLTVNGKGLASAKTSSQAREPVTLKLRLQGKAVKRLRAHAHGKHKRHLKTKIKLTFKPTHGKKLTKTIKARI